MSNVPKLRFSEFDGEWEEKKLGEITFKIGSGSTPKGGEKVYQNQGIVFIRSQNVKNDRLVLDDVTYISEKINLDMKNSIVNSNDILLNITGASIGRSCVVPQNFKEGNVNQHVCIIRVEKNINPHYLQFLLSSYIGQKLIYQGQTGSGREGLNFKSIALFKFNLPKKPEQQKIANFLTSIDKKIELLESKITHLERYKKGLMQKIFSLELRFRRDDGEIFEDWEEKKLGELSDVRDGTHDSPKYYENGFPLITSKNLLKNGFIDFENINLILEEDYQNINKRSKVSLGDILFGMIGTIGNPVIVRREKFAIKNVALIKEKSLLKNSFLIHYLKSSLIEKQFYKQNTGGTQKFIALGIIRNLKIKLPCIEEQQKIANFLSSIDKKIEQTQKALEEMKAFKKGLLQGMFV